MPQDLSSRDAAVRFVEPDHSAHRRGRAWRSGYLFDDGLYRALRELGFRVRIEFDVDDWKSFIRTTEWPVVNSSADPDHHDFAAGEVFWMRLSHGSETVATQVFRVISTDDYVGMIADHSLFFGVNPSGFTGFRMLSADAVPAIGGLVVQLSGLYISPKWRRIRTADGTRLVAAWTRLSHSFTARNLMADWSVSLLEERVASPRMVEDLYGYPHSIELFETYIPYLDRHERVTLVWMSAAELVGSVASRPRPIAQPVHGRPSMAGSCADI